MSSSLRACSGTGSVIFDICLVLILKQGLDAVSWLTNSVLCVALWSKYKILNPFLPFPVQEAPGRNMSLWWEVNISFLGWSFYLHMALVGVCMGDHPCSSRFGDPVYSFCREQFFWSHNFACNVVSSKIFKSLVLWVILDFSALTKTNYNKCKYSQIIHLCKGKKSSLSE